MRIERRFTEAGKSPYDGIEFRTTTSEIKNPDGSIVFQARNIEVPAEWSQVACDVLAQKYFRKAGVPVRLKSRARSRSARTGSAVTSPTKMRWPKLDKEQRTSGETKATQVFDRMAGTWTYWGWRGGYFDARDDARAYLRRAALHAGASRWRAPNSPQWFNTGLHWAYGIDGPSQGPLLRRLPDGQAGRLGSRPMSIRSPMPASSSRCPTTW